VLSALVQSSLSTQCSTQLPPVATPITTPEGTLSVCFEPFAVGFVDRPLSFLLPPFVPAVRLQRSCVSTV
jgi:hypothetical protein